MLEMFGRPADVNEGRQVPQSWTGGPMGQKTNEDR